MWLVAIVLDTAALDARPHDTAKNIDNYEKLDQLKQALR